MKQKKVPFIRISVHNTWLRDPEGCFILVRVPQSQTCVSCVSRPPPLLSVQSCYPLANLAYLD